jgi:hypothetical protein
MKPSTDSKPRRLPPTFGLYDAHDMLAKLKREFGRLRRLRKHRAIEDTVFNFAVTAWHMVDWVCADGLVLGTVPAGSPRTEYQRYARETCRELAALEIFANGQKHARREKHKPSGLFASEPSYITIGQGFEEPYQDPHPDPYVDNRYELKSSGNLTVWTDEPPPGALTVAFHYRDDECISVYTLAELCQGALAFWEEHLTDAL